MGLRAEAGRVLGEGREVEPTLIFFGGGGGGRGGGGLCSEILTNSYLLGRGVAVGAREILTNSYLLGGGGGGGGGGGRYDDSSQYLLRLGCAGLVGAVGSRIVRPLPPLLVRGGCGGPGADRSPSRGEPTPRAREGGNQQPLPSRSGARASGDLSQQGASKAGLFSSGRSAMLSMHFRSTLPEVQRSWGQNSG